MSAEEVKSFSDEKKLRRSSVDVSSKIFDKDEINPMIMFQQQLLGQNLKEMSMGRLQDAFSNPNSNF